MRLAPRIPRGQDPRPGRIATRVQHDTGHAIVDPGRISGGCATLHRKDPLQPRHRVRVEQPRTLAVAHLYADDLRLEPSLGQCPGSAGVALHRQRVLGLPRDTVIPGNILRSDAHMDAI
jgi:hypothetical protein